LEPRFELRIDPLVNEMRSYFKLWRDKYPIDPYLTSEWERMRTRYML
jgi:hypothetical protein